MHATIQVVPFDNPDYRRKKVTINDVEVGWIAHVIEAAFCGEWDSERQAALDADTLTELLA